MSYVDNWEAQSTQPEATCAALEAMDSFASELDIKLDRAKTYSWGTTPASRKTLKARGYTVMLHAKDLGGQLNYSKKALTTQYVPESPNPSPCGGGSAGARPALTGN